uniref:Uncharacterized protein n=1 Tax=Ditylenchus dipsaci TaxID=166011 RepID=A0A915CVS9_9BILA
MKAVHRLSTENASNEVVFLRSMKFSFFILSIGLMLQSLHPFIQSSGVAAEENVMLKYQLITKNDEVPGHLKGLLNSKELSFL